MSSEQLQLVMRAVDGITPVLSSMTRQMQRMEANTQASMRKAEAALRKTEAGARKTTESVGGLTSAFRAMGPAIAMLGIGNFVRGAIDAAAAWERLSTAIGAMEGSAERSADVQRMLYEAAKAPGVGMQELQRGYLTFKGLGIEAEKSVAVFQALGKAVALSGGGAQQFEGVVRQLGQAIGKGRILQEEVSNIAENMPMIATLMERAFGTKNVESLRSMGIGANEFAEGIARAAQELPDASATMGNALENLSTAWSRFKASFVNTDFVRETADFWTAELERITAAATRGEGLLGTGLFAKDPAKERVRLVEAQTEALENLMRVRSRLEAAEAKGGGDRRYLATLQAAEKQGEARVESLRKQIAEQDKKLGGSTLTPSLDGGLGGKVDPIKAAEEAERRRKAALEASRKEVEALRVEYNRLAETEANMAKYREEQILSREQDEERQAFADLEAEMLAWEQSYEASIAIRREDDAERMKAIVDRRNAEMQAIQEVRAAGMAYVASFGNAMSSTLAGAYLKARQENSSFLAAALDGFRQMLIQMTVELAARAATFAILSAVTGGTGGIFAQAVGGPASFIFGGRASGGAVSAGTPYMVGEHRRESFVPDRPGRIAPTVSGAQVSITINAAQGMDEERLAQRVSRAIEDAQRRRLREVY